MSSLHNVKVQPPGEQKEGSKKKKNNKKKKKKKRGEGRGEMGGRGEERTKDINWY